MSMRCALERVAEAGGWAKSPLLCYRRGPTTVVIGWDALVAFGLAHPAVFAIMSAAISTTKPATKKPGVRGAATASSASLEETSVRTTGERALLVELLTRLAASAKP